MEYRVLGSTGVSVSNLCLGTMMFGEPYISEHSDAVALMHKAFDAGINFVDTADGYARGEAEEVVGKGLQGVRDEIVLATKVWAPMGEDRNMRGASRRWIIRECEASLRRLQTDYIDLYQIHRPDPDTDIDETLGALSDLVRAGKVLYVGSSTFPASQIVEAQWMSERRGRERFVCEQAPYSILVREVEKDVLPTCQRHGIGVITWSPLDGGWLSGKWGKNTLEISGLRSQRVPARYSLELPGNRDKLEAVIQLSEIVAESDISMTELAVAWVLSNKAVTAAIIGPRTIEQLDGVLGASSIALDDTLLKKIDQVVAPGTTLNQADQA